MLYNALAASFTTVVDRPAPITGTDAIIDCSRCKYLGFHGTVGRRQLLVHSLRLLGVEPRAIANAPSVNVDRPPHMW